MRKRVVWSAVLALVMGGQALADGMSYNYLQGGLIGTRIKAGGDSDSGAGARFEGQISNNMPVFVFFNLSTNKYSKDSDNLKLTQVSAGVGGHLSLTSSIDLVGGLSYESIRLIPHIPFSPVPQTDANPSRGGLGFGAGFRGQVGPRLDWNAGVKYRDIQRLKNQLSVTAGGRYYLTSALAVGADLTWIQYSKNTIDATESIVGVSLRYQFNDPW